MNRKVLIAGILILGLIIGIIILKWIFKPAEKDTGSKKADFEISAYDLTDQFTSNEEKSNSLYLNKIIIVNGIINSITEENSGFSVYLKGKDDASGVLCTFSQDKPDTNKLKAGDNVKIKGICSGYLLDVVMNKCSFVK